MSSKVVGIDLGTTDCCVAVYENGNAKVLTNEEGDPTTPSYVYVIEKDEILVGCSAQSMASKKNEFGIYDIKRLIGRKFDDPEIQNSLKDFPFTIDGDKNKDLIIKIHRKYYHTSPTVVQLWAAILRKIKNDVENKLEDSVDQAVITVPSYFNISQRRATLLAASEAGFTVLKLLDEPTAIALNYYLRYDKQENHVLLYDLGGGTFDVAVVKKIGSDINIIGLDGDTHLGGRDFDNLITDYVCDHLKTNYNFDLRSDPKGLIRLRHLCESAKKRLSSKQETSIFLHKFIDNHPTITIKLTRASFEEMAKSLFEKTINTVDVCLKNCEIPKTDIKEVILVGASTRIPKIQKMISEYFDGKALINTKLNPDECVARGAAVQAAILSTNANQKIRILKKPDVTPLSLGIDFTPDVMDFFIPKDTPFPVSVSKVYTNGADQQETMPFDIYEGDRAHATDNYLLGTLVLKGMTPKPPGQCEVEITMSIDEKGVLKVKADELLCDNVEESTLLYTRGHRSDREIQDALRDAEENRVKDEAYIAFAKLKSYFLDYCEATEYNLNNKGLTTTYRGMSKMCSTMQRVVDTMDVRHVNQLKGITESVKKKCDVVANEYDFEFMPELSDYE